VTRAKESVRAFRAAVDKSAAATERFELHLFIAGTTPRSAAALVNVTAVCEERLQGRYDLFVIDVYQEPSRARDAQIIAVPTLFKKSPAPVCRLIGDLSDRQRLLAGLDLSPDPPPDPPRERERSGKR
jgi:circadian clock protein KaiB